MSGLTREQYEAQQAACDSLCTIDDTYDPDKTGLMRCVTCPFCKAAVDAILTPVSISCPACKVTIQR